MLNLKIHNETQELSGELSRVMAENEDKLRLAQAGDSAAADSLGWLSVEEWAGEKYLQQFEAIAARIRADENAAFVLIGVGGSNNAARSVIEALKEEPGSLPQAGTAPKENGTGCCGEALPDVDNATRKSQCDPEIIYAGNTLSAHAIAAMLRRLGGKSVYIDCIAKNFETLEPGSAFRILRQYLEERYGDGAKDRIIATGTKGSSLERLCQDNGYMFLEFPLNVGGRYTAMTSVGLLPMAVAGIDIRALVRGARDMERELRQAGPQENTAYRYACLRNLYYRKGYRVEMLASFEPQLRWFYKWWIQLFAESEGKDDRGLFPVSGEFTEELHSVGQFLQDGTPIFFETFLDVKDPGASVVVMPDDKEDFFDYLDGKDFRDINRAAYEATVKAHSQKFPCLTLEVPSIDAYHFGGLFYYFEFACVCSCYVMGVNPFNQPGVEAYKGWMFEALGK